MLKPNPSFDVPRHAYWGLTRSQNSLKATLSKKVVLVDAAEYAALKRRLAEVATPSRNYRAATLPTGKDERKSCPLWLNCVGSRLSWAKRKSSLKSGNITVNLFSIFHLKQGERRRS